MRFNNEKGEYPLPILRPREYQSDYENSDFKFDLTVKTDQDPHSLSIEFYIGHEGIRKLVYEGKASLSLAIHCEATYLYQMIDLGADSPQSITYDQQKFFGDVFFTLVVKAVTEFNDFSPSGLVKSLSGLGFSVCKGDFIAISQEIKFFFGLPPLKLGADIFILEESPDLEDYAFEVGTSNSKIEIYVGSKLNELIQSNMSTEPGRVRNISSVYFPALIEVLYQMKNGEDFSGMAWHEAIAEAMRRLGFDLENKDWEPLYVAQKLLRFPYQKLQDVS